MDKLFEAIILIIGFILIVYLYGTGWGTRW